MRKEGLPPKPWPGSLNYALLSQCKNMIGLSLLGMLARCCQHLRYMSRLAGIVVLLLELEQVEGLNHAL